MKKRHELSQKIRAIQFAIGLVTGAAIYLIQEIIF